MSQDPIAREAGAILNDKLNQVIAKQDEHSIALANHTAVIHRIERKLETMETRFDGVDAVLREILDRLPPKP